MASKGVYIQKVEAPGLVKIDTYIGRRMDLHCTAVGKVILAFGPAEVLERVLAKPVYIRHTRSTITSPTLMHREVLRIRKFGYAVDDEEEEPGVRCVAVPTYHANGAFAAGLSVTGRLRRYRCQRSRIWPPTYRRRRAPSMRPSAPRRQGDGITG
jgi:IclR family transcriptional regulator, KDG regulon repressor